MNRSPSHRMYYAALVCPPEVDAKVLQFKHWMRDRFDCMAALKSPGHITLIPPFWMDENMETTLLQTADSFAPGINDVEVQMSGFSHFNQKVLFINIDPNPSLEELKNKAEDHFILTLGDIIRKDERPFHPHITIATRDVRPNDFMKAWEHFSSKNFSAAFSTKTISILKLGTAKWSVIEEYAW